MIQKAKAKEEKAQRAKLSGKITELQSEINRILQNITQLSLDVARFKPITNNANVTKIYETSVTTINDAEKSLNKMLVMLKNNPDEKVLMNMEADLAAEKSKLTFISKTLEDNFVVDSKYVFDDTFNKIAWVYNVAQNNSSYYASLTEAYMEQIYMMDGTDNSVPKEKQDELSDDIQSVMLEMDKITALHNKIRENYLTIIDAVKVSEMRKNNEVANQALETILSYTEYMDKMIIDSIDKFSVVLDIQSRDYDDYMVYPPKNANEIDVSKPTIHVENKTNKKEKITENTEEQSKSDKTDTNAEAPTTLEQSKIDTLSLNLQEPKNGLFSLISKIKTAKEENTLSSDLQFAGISDAIKKSTQQAESILEIASDKIDTKETLPVAVAETEKVEQPKEAIAVAEATDVQAPLKKEITEETLPESMDKPEKAEKKTLDNPSDLFLADIEELKDKVSEQSVVAESIKDNINQSLINNTQTAMDEILQNIKKTEEGYQTLLAEHQKDIAKNKVADNAIEVKIPENLTPPVHHTDVIQPHPEDGQTKLKVNPVIALGIGKNVLTEQEQKLAARLEEKTGFKKNSDIAAQSKDKTKAEKKDTPKEKTNKIVTAQTQKEQKIQKLPPVDTQALRKDVLKSMLAYEADKNTYLPRVRKMIDEAPVYVDNEPSSDNQQNHYVFASSLYPNQPASGLVEKSMYAHVKTAKNRETNQKYLFAVNDTFYSPELRGRVNKNTTLYVK